MDYQGEIKEVLKNASEEARKIVNATIEIERSHRWQEDHKGLKTEIMNDISTQVMDIVK